MQSLFRFLVALALAAAAARAPAKPPEPPREAPRAAPSPPASAEGSYETGRLTGTDQSVAGPFVLTFLAAGAELEVVSSTPGGGVLGRVAGPLAAPLHLAAGTFVRLPVAGDVLYAGVRPAPMTRALEAWVGRPILLAVAGGAAEPWTLRALGAGHLTLERSRTYRVLPLRRVAEITWTELTGIDPTPRVVLARE